LVEMTKRTAYLLLCLLLASCWPGDESGERATEVAETLTAIPPAPPLTTAEAYPPPASPTVELAYQVVTPTIRETAVAAYPPPELTAELFMPFVSQDEFTPTPLPTATATPIPPLDFEAIRADLRANGQELAYVQIGFHTGSGGNTDGLEEWMRRLDAAGIPFFLKSADNAEPLYIAQKLRKESGVPHTLVFRRSVGQEASGGFFYDVPRYELPPEQAARIHWDLHIAEWPPELDPDIVWLETINEVDRNRAEWLAQFALATAELALADGYKWAAFGWAAGVPEPEQWQTPAMLQFLRLAGENPDRLAIALHEYSYVTDNIQREYPYLIGRFQQLFLICDQHGIPRPTVLITEWGWTHQRVPEPPQAIEHIAWASNLYAQYPEVRGAAIWYLGPGFGGIADRAQRLIEPLTEYALRNYHIRPLPPAQTPIDPALFER
jgi:hypothetical protein